MDAASPKKRFWSSRRVLVLVAVILAPVLAFGLYVFFTLNFAYSQGDRSGILQKLSKKGWLCKTYEGELAVTTTPGVSPVIWSFSVRDEKVVEDLNAALGKSVVLTYTEHPGVPSSCFGETPYFVSGVSVQENQH